MFLYAHGIPGRFLLLALCGPVGFGAVLCLLLIIYFQGCEDRFDHFYLMALSETPRALEMLFAC